MHALLLLLLIVSLLGVLHTYVLYPYLTLGAAERRCKDASPPGPIGDWPRVHVLMSVHNEAVVLPEKLASLARIDYPGPLHFHLGSDRSTDGSEALLHRFAAAHSATLTLNERRLGKPGTINRLVREIDTDGVLVFTDASVILRPDTVTELVRPMLTDESIGVTDATMVHTGVPGGGVGSLEDQYIRREVALKRAESCLWQAMIGPFGGCWAMRAAAFRPVPDTFLVDDFFLCMSAYEAGWRGAAAPEAVAYEGVGLRLGDEFRRKRRIGAGNWQNLLRFRRLWWPPSRDPLAYAFFSHKILRWLTPLLLSIGGLSLLALLLLDGNYWIAATFLLLMALICAASPAVRYFSAMNVALLLGLVDYLTGIKTNVWQPSHRHQDDG
ncbi:glycosyltransferase family 2 protein [Neolewinella xylanilytica]|uniref:glycosyltransferase family 2 protein n=1 Tax=Neolewinella xylanilytica TaxID=1514080 RepID=UPI000CEB0D66|nr:glycosyltransferase family 2 protein [Neolewinella xylanilytica]